MKSVGRREQRKEDEINRIVVVHSAVISVNHSTPETVSKPAFKRSSSTIRQALGSSATLTKVIRLPSSVLSRYLDLEG